MSSIFLKDSRFHFEEKDGDGSSFRIFCDNTGKIEFEGFDDADCTNVSVGRGRFFEYGKCVPDNPENPADGYVEVRWSGECQQRNNF